MVDRIYLISILFVIVMIVSELFLESILNKNNFPLYKNPVGIELTDKDFQGTRAPEHVAGTDECSIASLKTCQLDNIFSCSSCKQILSKCVHFSGDSTETSNGVTVPPNAEGEGYCLPLSDDRNDRKCTAKNGGKWVLVSDNSNTSYTFICMCTKSMFFEKNSLESDCDTFVGCRNGVIANPSTWTTFDTIECQCPAKYDAIPGTLSMPGQCVLKNIFRFQSDEYVFTPLDNVFVSAEYLAMVGNDVQLPNPCQYDIATRIFNPNIGRVLMKDGVAFCEATDSHYIEVTQTDDYLSNNQGRYANAIMRILKDVPQHTEYLNDIVYEVFRNEKNVDDQPLVGRRVSYEDSFIRLPYFESTSYNMGNREGVRYELQPSRDVSSIDIPRMLVYSGLKPTPLTLVLGNSLTWVPSFMSTSFQSGYRVYNGNLPYMHLLPLNDNSLYVIYPVPPASCAGRYLGRTGSVIGETYKPDFKNYNFAKWYDMPMILKNNKIQPYSTLFTGTILTYEREGVHYTKPLSPGSLPLCTKYRRHYDPEWTAFNLPANTRLTTKIIDCPKAVATDLNAHLFTENAFNYEQSEIGVPFKHATQYRFNVDGTVSFASFLN